MIKEKAKYFMQRLEFPSEAQSKLLNQLDILLLTDDFSKIVSRYDGDVSDFTQMLEDAKSLAEKNKISSYAVYMLLFICMAPVLHKKYVQNGINDKIFYDTMTDLKYKLDECRLVYGEWGTFVPVWYKGFFEMRIFALGRLQFEINHTWFECTVDGVHIPKNTKVLSVHIPRTGTKLEHSLVVDSYRQASEFFKEEFDENIIFICNSWLLYPWNRSILKDGSNLAKFYDDFTIVSSGEYENYSEIWRLFDCIYDGNPDNLPNDTSLRCKYVERIRSVKPIGHGTGVILYNK